MDEYIVADVSGTNTRVAIIRDSKILRIRDYLTKDINKFSDLISMYMYLEKLEIQNIVLSVASGRINENRIKLSNNNLEISRDELKLIGFKKIDIINDFQAVAYGVKDVEKNLEITPQISNQNYLVIGAGTGLGINKFENGRSIDLQDGLIHVDIFENLTLKELDLIEKFSLEHGKNFEIEEILSGRGIEKIYQYLTGVHLTAQEISNLENNSSQETFDLFYSFYIKVIIYFLEKFNLQQVYVAGGIIMKNMKYFSPKIKEDWINKLNKKGCTIILDYDVSLYGLRNYIKFNS